MRGVIWSYKEGLEHFKAAVICKLFEAKSSERKDGQCAEHDCKENTNDLSAVKEEVKKKHFL